MDMPTPCPGCGEVVELNDMRGILDNTMVCEECWCETCGGDGCCMECDGGACEHCGGVCPVCGGRDQCQDCDGLGYAIPAPPDKEDA